MYFYCFGNKESIESSVNFKNASTLLLTSVIDSNDDQLHFSKNSRKASTAPGLNGLTLSFLVAFFFGCQDLEFQTIVEWSEVAMGARIFAE